jgi:DNA-binding transcriptional regulator YdaS (Cro superfamily)
MAKTKLKEYLFHNDISVTDFANRLGATRNYISLISLGKFHPSEFLAREIERQTNGEVTVKDLRGDK